MFVRANSTFNNVKISSCRFHPSGANTVAKKAPALTKPVYLVGGSEGESVLLTSYSKKLCTYSCSTGLRMRITGASSGYLGVNRSCTRISGACVFHLGTQGGSGERHTLQDWMCSLRKTHTEINISTTPSCHLEECSTRSAASWHGVPSTVSSGYQKHTSQWKGLLSTMRTRTP